jgi:hypothetical protein
MRIFWPNSREVKDGEITEEQREAIDILRQRHGLTDNVEIKREFGGDAVILNTGRMWFGVETDGYAHT